MYCVCFFYVSYTSGMPLSLSLSLSLLVTCREAREKFGRSNILKAARAPTKPVKYKGT